MRAKTNTLSETAVDKSPMSAPEVTPCAVAAVEGVAVVVAEVLALV